MGAVLQLIEPSTAPSARRELNLEELGEYALAAVVRACPRLTGFSAPGQSPGTRIEGANVGLVCGRLLVVSAQTARRAVRSLVRDVKALRMVSTIDPLVPFGVIACRVVRDPATRVSLRLVAAHAPNVRTDESSILVRIDVVGRVKA